MSRTRLEPVGMTEIAERLGVELNTVRSWRKRGRLPTPVGTVSGQPAWNAPAIDAWWEQYRVISERHSQKHGEADRGAAAEAP